MGVKDCLETVVGKPVLWPTSAVGISIELSSKASRKIGGLMRASGSPVSCRRIRVCGEDCGRFLIEAKVRPQSLAETPREHSLHLMAASFEKASGPRH